MRGWFDRMGRKLAIWMEGRYGQDELSSFLSVVSLVFLFLMVVWQGFGIVSLLILIYSSFRIYSKNILKRQHECEVYLRVTAPIRGWFSLQGRRWSDRKHYRYFRCRKCKNVLRVPVGKGKIEVTCPKCQEKTIKKT